jgi:hypothetical protein
MRTSSSDEFLADDLIAAMSPTERRELIHRLERPIGELLGPAAAYRIRRTRLGLMIGGAIALIPWMIHLALTLPETYTAHNWPATWVGFDMMLVTFMAATAVLGWLRRQLLLLTSFTTGVLLICDAWFDVMTAGPRDMPVAALTAALAELPLAAILIGGAMRVLRLTAARLWLLDRHTPLWRLPLLP